MTGKAPQISITDLLAAVEAASADIAAMSDRVTALEATNYRLEEENGNLRAQLAEMIGRVDSANAAAHAASQRADQAEMSEAAHSSRADQAQADLAAANDDVGHISTAVSDLVARGQPRG